LSQAGDANNVVSTDSLNLHLSQPLGSLRPLSANRVRAGVDFLASLRSDPRVTGRCYVHVEAGIKIKQLFRDLGECGLDLPTSGAGGGQSVAGALSTGSHGADFRVPVLVDWIRAAHVVSSAGREFWITSAGSPFGGSAAHNDICADAQFIADDSALDAVRVGIGRFGVVYSLVLEVLPAYGLLEVYLQHHWQDLRSALALSTVAPTGTFGAFDIPLADFESGWFKSETRSRTLVRYSPPEPEPTHASEMHYLGGPPHDLAPVHPTIEPRLYHTMLTELGLDVLGASLRGDGLKPLHHMNIAISLAEPDKCWVTRRWRVSPTLPKVFQTGVSGPPDPIQKAVEEPLNHRRPTALIGPLRTLLTPTADLPFPLPPIGGKWLPALAACLGISAKASRIFEFRDRDIPRICQQHEQAGATIGEALFLILFKLASDPILQPESRIAAASAVSQLIGGDTVLKFVRCGLASEIIDTHDYKLDGAQSGNSAEYFFDATAGAHLRFVDGVMGIVNAHAPVFGYIGIRFMPKSSALLSMAQFPLTASVEVATARSRLEDVYAGFWADLHSLANSSQGIAHWGQEFRQTDTDIAARFGQNLVLWRRALGRVTGGNPTFSTSFSRLHGLEPEVAPGPTGDEDEDMVESYLTGLHTADI
jgi:hypothetical protein